MWNRDKKDVEHFHVFTFFAIHLQFTQKHNKKGRKITLSPLWWALTDSNRRPSACKADALNQLS